MVRSFQKLRAIDPGFNPSSALTFRLGLPDRDYPTREAAVAAHHAILDRLSALPGVTSVSAASAHPLVDRLFGNSIFVDGRPLRADPNRLPNPVVMFTAVAGGYVEAMGMRLVRGRTLDRGDVDRAEANILVNEAFVNAYFPNEDPVGRRIASSRPPTLPPPQWLSIVGIVGNTPSSALVERAPAPKVYMPMSIAGGPGIPITTLVGPNVAMMSYVVRTAASPLGLVSAVRREVDAVDANLAIAEVRTLQALLDRASAQMAFTMVLIAIAAGATLILGVVGIYGVMSYVVVQRTGEIGVRLALGAPPTRVAGMIVRQGAIVTFAGIVAGLAAAFAGSRLIGSLLYGIGPRDPLVFVVTTIVLLVVALVAAWLPARRAAGLNPLVALRSE
jgi:putative ABC transport system permease protein